MNPIEEWLRLIRHFETVYVPGLLQTADYARRILTEMVELHNLDIADVDAAVASRMQRQHLLYDTSKRFEFLLAEPVLRWLLCPAEVMRGQLDRRQLMCDRSPSVDVRHVPRNKASGRRRRTDLPNCVRRPPLGSGPRVATGR
ncbi:Scr1 family TA system antitoxin-like transcriptional regulator [Micromonospora sp. NPDC000316]|uniref:Scr1 family TA system antitoxin-like transcriptional regulator n=1 Tax=Micromonospora sp. NPDC000316 TaxID=3364216 RepID=UPI0036BCCECE